MGLRMWPILIHSQDTERYKKEFELKVMINYECNDFKCVVCF